MNLVLDIGNTKFKLSIFNNTNMVFHEYMNELNQHTIDDLLSKFKFNQLIFSDTRGVDKSKLSKLFPKSFPIYELNHKSKLPIQINYETPETLGKDRIAAAVGAYAKFPNNSVVIIDIGTALTIDFVSKDNCFEGGIISPGQELRFKALHHFTGKLPLEKPEVETQLTGLSTKQAIQFGVINGMAFEINEYIHRYTKQYPDLKILITGGDAYLFDRKINYTIFAESFLVPIGLNTILNNNE